jgi:Asp-tRNA(Asn)/Glu-tRNA(Gln) amidotransferase A subunit family amidase
MKNRSSFIANRILSGLFLTGLISGCVSSPQAGKASRDKSFISYWPAQEGSGLRLAVKDNINLKGEVTSAGSEYLAKNSSPATSDAPCLAIARQRNVQIVGKTNLTEFAVTVSGKNSYFGTPVNRWDGKNKYIPGGSSSGSAVAVASGKADVAFGTDTGGSIRVPAACCGVYGLKTTFGLVSTKGVFPISAKHLDTVGPLAADIPRLVQGMELLQSGFRGKYNAAVAAKPSARQIRIGRLYIGGTDPAIDKAIDEQLAAKGFQVVKLDDRFLAKWVQADRDGETIALTDAWRNDEKYLMQRGIGRTTRVVVRRGALDAVTGYDAAVKRKPAWQRDLRRIFEKVDFIATPTLQSLPPRLPWFQTIVFEMLVFNSQNTVGVNFAGNPALAVPIAMPAEKDYVPFTSLQLVGPRLSEAQLLNAGRILASNP